MKISTKFTLGMFALIFLVNFVSAFNGVVDFGVNGIDPSSYSGWTFFSNYNSDNHYCSGYFGLNVPNNRNNDACACDNSRGNKVTCCDSIDDTGIFVKNLNFYSYSENGYRISCTPLCVPAAEICDGKDNDCDGQVDEGIANIISGTDVGECRTGITQCVSGSWQVVQVGIGSTAEVCNNLDDDCDGFVDEDNVCGLEVCTDGEVADYSFENNYCYGSDVWNNFSFNLCVSNFWDLRFNQSFNSSCDYGCFNGSCIAGPGSELAVVISYPTNGSIFVSNSSPYQIAINANANQFVDNWSINGVGYSDSGFGLSKLVNIIFGINSLSVCGTNANGTDCDSVFVELINGSSQTNGTLFIEIISPTNMVYDTENILLNISSNGTNVWYNYNGTNITYNGSLILNLDEGSYNLVAWANNSDGDLVSDSISFSVNVDDDDDGDEDDENCVGCNDCEEEELESVFVDGVSNIYLYQNMSDNYIKSGNGDSGWFSGFDLILALIVLIIFLALLVILRFYF